MKGKTPLWLLCDVAACLRLHLALAVLGLAMRRFMPRAKMRQKPVSPEGVVWLTVWLACCERLLRWVIARQAFRLCGLDPNLARSCHVSEARSSEAWSVRGRSFARIYARMTVHARRWARRIREAMAAKPAAVPRACCALASLVSSSPFFVVTPAAAAAPAGQRIRAPPWPTATSGNTSPAPCRSTGEVAGVCAVTCCPTPGA